MEERRSGGSLWLVLCSDGPDWQSDRKWGVPKGRREGPMVRSSKTIQASLSSTSLFERIESRIIWRSDEKEGKNDHLRDLLRSVNDWGGGAALGRLDYSDVVFDLYHESSKFVPRSHFGLLIMSKCTEMARQPSHWVNLNGSNLQRGSQEREKGGRDLLSIRT